MRVTIPYPPYNARRDGRPWVARIRAWPTGGPMDVVWGQTLGTARAGGELVIDADPGAILRWGQNDLRRHNHTYRKYARVEADGTLTPLSEPEAARACATPAPARRAPHHPLTQRWDAEAARLPDPHHRALVYQCVADLHTLLTEMP